MKSTKRKAAAPARDCSGLSKQRKRNTTPTPRITPRQRRAIRALLQAHRTAQQLMRIAPCNNSAMLIKTLRDNYGATIPCEQVKFTTMDGMRSWYGRYSLTASDKTKLQKVLREGGV